MEQPQITINPVRAGEDPSITIYEVELKVETGIWRETYGNAELTEAFLRGVKAAYGINRQYVTTPEVPT